MTTDLLSKKIISIAAAAVWTAMTIGVIVMATTLLSGSATNSATVLPATTTTIVQQALLPGEPATQNVYSGNFENPFKPAGIALKPTAPSGQTAYVRKTLIIKGVLIKDRSLAIFAGENGEKLIGGIGDTVCGQIVTAITGESVTLRDQAGSYTLSTGPQ